MHPHAAGPQGQLVCGGCSTLLMFAQASAALAFGISQTDFGVSKRPSNRVPSPYVRDLRRVACMCAGRSERSVCAVRSHLQCPAPAAALRCLLAINGIASWCSLVVLCHSVRTSSDRRPRLPRSIRQIEAVSASCPISAASGRTPAPNLSFAVHAQTDKLSCYVVICGAARC